MKTIKVSLKYPHNSTTTPLVSTLVKKYNVEINIFIQISALISTLIVDITGEKDIEDALDFIVKQDGIRYKIFSNKLIWQEVAFTAGMCETCPSNALTITRRPGVWNSAKKSVCLRIVYKSMSPQCYELQA